MKPIIKEENEIRIIGMEVLTNLVNNSIPDLWNRFFPRMAEVSHNINPCVCYGICMNDPDFDIGKFTDDTEFRYIAGLRVSDFSIVPEGMVTHVLPPQRYAVFTHRGSLQNLRTTYDYIYGAWAASTDLKICPACDFELYDNRFNPQDQENSELDIYVPIE
jgi:AraC family transcriptional regulator